MTPVRLGVAAWIALIALEIAWYLWLAPPAGGRAWLALAITVPPLLLPLLALPSGITRALLWLGVVALFYFSHGVVAAWVAPDVRVPALIEALLCVVVIAALGWNARRGRAR